ncbi:MAG: DEAD/DEAH box helicase [Clostridiales bacterium]|jgi:ATP-dependent RNA helicase DeaD|nr:DEAD/DEAH box helicase [Clostridiales bacterium]OPZ69958.1 MAG: DEAD-box ATP-dependent RNA helicase CshA [Firmicutes bacterium ADurb.Bin467]
MNNNEHSTAFAGAALSPEIQTAIDSMGFESATPVQQRTIPAMLSGIDLIVQAPTGTGKTCAFGIPIAQIADARNRSAQALVLSPTRELAIQTSRVLGRLTQSKKGVRIATLYGGERIERQFSVLRARPQIIVATPGRLLDHMRRGSVHLDAVRTVVLDEADRMLDMGFQDDLNDILRAVPAERQTVLFSATIPAGVREIAKNYQRAAKHIAVRQDAMTVRSVRQFYTTVGNGAKNGALLALLKDNAQALCLVFVNTKRMADALCGELQRQNLRADALHGDIQQQKRERIMNAFRAGRLDVLVATDVAARGIDVRNIDLVVNYDLPLDSDCYVHRIGRTGRAERLGTAHTLIYRQETGKLNAIMRDTRAPIQRAQAPAAV